ncbi:hypothetical protein C8J56DRAFT_896592 [Mycena floridula]|nr:hypothetical protein C8J56DRAFT_896592 [Mycena floridula]
MSAHWRKTVKNSMSVVTCFNLGLQRCSRCLSVISGFSLIPGSMSVNSVSLCNVQWSWIACCFIYCSLIQAIQNGVLTKVNNTPQDRFTSNATRQNSRRSKAQESSATSSALNEIELELVATQQRAKELREQAKSLKEQHPGLKSQRKMKRPTAGASRHESISIGSSLNYSH